MSETQSPANPPMTRERFAEYVRHVADLLGLRHWEIELSRENPRDNGLASVARCDSRYAAILRVSTRLLAGAEKEIRYAAVHEAVHLHMAHVDRLSTKELTGHALDAWMLADEYAVSGLAAAVAPFLPLPSQVFPTGRPETAKKPSKTAKNKAKPS